MLALRKLRYKGGVVYVVFSSSFVLFSARSLSAGSDILTQHLGPGPSQVGWVREELAPGWFQVASQLVIEAGVRNRALIGQTLPGGAQLTSVPEDSCYSVRHTTEYEYTPKAIVRCRPPMAKQWLIQGCQKISCTTKNCHRPICAVDAEQSETNTTFDHCRQITT
eukprot:2281103-Rhodomonas_salina.2